MSNYTNEYVHIHHTLYHVTPTMYKINESLGFKPVPHTRHAHGLFSYST